MVWASIDVNIGKAGEKWLHDEFTNLNTQRIYRVALKNFMLANEIVDLDDYFENTRLQNHVMTGIKRFLAYMNNHAPVTTRSYLIGVKQFFEEHEVEVADDALRRARRRRSGKRIHALTDDRAPTLEELRKIMDYLPIKR